METNLTIINAALTATGNGTIASLEDGQASAMIAAQNYDRLVRAELEAHPWTWAASTWALNLLSGTPATGGQFAWQLPGDVAKVQRVEVAGRPITYTRMADQIRCDHDAGVVLVGIRRPDESEWPANFASAMVIRLEALFLRAIGEDYDKAQARDKDADLAFRLARVSDSQGKTAQDPYQSALLRARRA